MNDKHLKQYFYTINGVRHQIPAPHLAPYLPSPLADPARAGCAKAGRVQKVVCWSFSLKQLFKPKKQNQ